MIDYYPTRKLENEEITERWFMPSPNPSNEALAGYAENGFVIIKGFFSDEEVAVMKGFADHNYESPDCYFSPEPATGKVRSILGFHDCDGIKQIAFGDKLMSMAKDILREEAYIHQSRVNYKRGMESNGWKWHSDFETWHYQDGMPEMKCFSAMIPLEENTAVNGPLMVLTGSHKEFVCCPKPTSNSSAEENFSDQKEGIPSGDAIAHFMRTGSIEVVTCSPGDVVLFDCNILHVSNPNVTPFGRMNMFFVYNAKSNMLKEPYSGLAPRPIEMGTR